MALKNPILFRDPEVATKILNLASIFVSHCRSHNERISQRTSHITVKILSLDSNWSYILKDDVQKREKQQFLKVILKLYNIISKYCLM
ncbi:hypothetical protein NPIL_638721 [Nephila pilipes]|uniref:Uncharacterized protein n=1 Tax=Nephila pilipes TaxID=299642 RepID=A0A8X6NNP4_NEPPI|nr:hypothetical protein NPIL_638721 [Nephila pilipes]